MSAQQNGKDWLDLSPGERAIRKLDALCFELIHAENVTASQAVDESPGNPLMPVVLTAVTQRDDYEQLQLINAFRHDDQWDADGALKNRSLGHSAAVAVMRRIAQLAPRKPRPARRPPASVSPSGRVRRFAGHRSVPSGPPSPPSVPPRHLHALPDPG